MGIQTMMRTLDDSNFTNNKNNTLHSNTLKIFSFQSNNKLEKLNNYRHSKIFKLNHKWITTL